MPLAIYLLWDMLLWVARPEESDLGLDKTVNNWSKIDALTMIALLVVGCFQLVRTSHGYSFNFEFLAVAFVVIMTGVIVSDYYLNRHFYFPDELDRGKSV
jgi:purine-cytosine permease-like protein